MSKNPVFNYPCVISNPRFIGMIHLSVLDCACVASKAV